MGYYNTKNIRNISMAIALLTGLALIGVLPAFGIGLTTSVFGALNVGTLLGIGNLAIFYWIYSRKM